MKEHAHDEGVAEVKERHVVACLHWKHARLVAEVQHPQKMVQPPGAIVRL